MKLNEVGNTCEVTLDVENVKIFVIMILTLE